ncbi:MAG: nucleoside-diphosphate sugar epimerase/dehydratase [Desulfobacterales bacterium]|jgi:FlaA1/EpsC-like NDP-sugar epimerase|nr:nucleoside-diphosphate sugar epimerase/dehydratase [Desulfobacterales bacterium]
MFLRIKNDRNFFIMLLVDALLVSAAYYLAHLFRFEGAFPAAVQEKFRLTLLWIVPVKIGFFFIFELYKGMWRYTSVHDLISIVKACVVSSVTIGLVIFGIYHFRGFSRSVFFIDFVLTFLFISGFRVTIRFFFTAHFNHALFRCFNKDFHALKRLLIIGAGSAGEKLLRELIENPKLNYNVIGFIDDNPDKLKNTLHRVPVLGAMQDLNTIATDYGIEEIIIAVPSATAAQIRRIVGFCKSTGIPFKTLPGIGELVAGKIVVSAIRDIRYEDLLGRPQVCIENEQICGYITGKRVLVTGGAGSIGSELCRQIARFHPESLVVVERNESGLYDIDLKLKADHPELAVKAVLGAIQNKGIMTQVFQEHRPQTVFHAAAYKHVPMMESHPWEAVFNNVVGTHTIIGLCRSTGVERCVIVSTDKAVRPTNVMGATKRMIELLTECYAVDSRCRFMAVRFGNVLGSAGSVLPLFKRQIERGGPVTVTHPEVTRYFMTIPEACSLILQAGAIGKGREIFVLKMGTPVLIDSMARDLITLSGFTPDKDINVVYTGLRPGEKLYEELITEGEDIQKTGHADIMVLKADDCLPLPELKRHLEALVLLAERRDADGIKRKLNEIVPEYTPQFDILDPALPSNVIPLTGEHKVAYRA